MNILDVAENSVRAGATLIEISLVEDSAAGELCLTIADNGKGGAQSGEAGRGLANMKNRARALGADYALTSTSGEGTRVTLTLRQPALAMHPM